MRSPHAAIRRPVVKARLPLIPSRFVERMLTCQQPAEMGDEAFFLGLLQEDIGRIVADAHARGGTVRAGYYARQLLRAYPSWPLPRPRH
jgi:hypothetical protein